MKNPLNPWRVAAAASEAGQWVGVMLVVESEGSAPGKVGFTLALTQDDQVGTIGGGVMEHNLLEQLRAMQTQQEAAVKLVHQVHQAQAPADERSGMICAGRQRVALWVAAPQNPLLQAAWEAERDKSPKTFALDPTGLKALSQNASQEFDHTDAHNWTFRFRLGDPHRVYVIGGGHVGAALCRALAPLDLHVTCFDARALVQTEPPQADAVIVAPYTELAQHIQPGPKTFAIVVSPAFHSDTEALAQILSVQTGFVGLMGSKAKISRIRKELRARGVSEQQLGRIQAPVGIPINNRTPAEIAISIAAQIIQVRNSHD